MHSLQYIHIKIFRTACVHARVCLSTPLRTFFHKFIHHTFIHTFIHTSIHAFDENTHT